LRPMDFRKYTAFWLRSKTSHCYYFSKGPKSNRTDRTRKRRSFRVTRF
jgi:hypothetical protein